MLVGESHVEYLVRKLNEATAAKDQRDALAVENAERGEIIERLIGIFTASGYHAIQDSYDPCMALLYDAFQAIKHPSTSAAIAAIEARGVEKALAIVEACRGSICAGGLSENRQYEESIVHPHLDGISDELESLAAELREAK